MKKVVERATYPELMQHQFLKHHAAAVTDIAAFVAEVLDNSTEEDEKEKKAWAIRDDVQGRVFKTQKDTAKKGHI